MTADVVINKIVITDEARFDYESLFGLPIPRADMKGECEKYIDNISGQNIGYYIRAKYYDETIDEMLMLFFYKGKDISKMQMWELAGIDELEEISKEKSKPKRWQKLRSVFKWIAEQGLQVAGWVVPLVYKIISGV